MRPSDDDFEDFDDFDEFDFDEETSFEKAKRVPKRHARRAFNKKRKARLEFNSEDYESDFELGDDDFDDFYDVDEFDTYSGVSLGR